MDAWLILGTVLIISLLAIILNKPFFRDLDALDEAYFAEDDGEPEQADDLIAVIRKARTVEDLFVEMREVE